MVRIDVYADIACPWCYIGERRLEQALAQRPDLRVERTWLPFQLQAQMPRRGVPWGEFARRKFGGEERARVAFERVRQAGAVDGLRFDFERMPTAPNTLDAHRLVLLAGEHGRTWEAVETLFKAYFSDGQDVSAVETLVEIGVESVGLEAETVREFLAGEQYAAEVRASQATAHQLGIQGVPFFVFEGRYAISGAQPVGIFLQALELASAEAMAVAK